MLIFDETKRNKMVITREHLQHLVNTFEKKGLSTKELIAFVQGMEAIIDLYNRNATKQVNNLK